MRPWLAILFLLIGCDPPSTPVDIVFSIDEASCGACTAEEFLLPDGASVGLTAEVGINEVVRTRCAKIGPGEALSQMLLEPAFMQTGDEGIPEARVAFRLQVFVPASEDEFCFVNDEDATPAATGQTTVDLSDFENPISVAIECRSIQCPSQSAAQ